MIYIQPLPRVLQVFTILDRGGAETMIMNYYRNIDRTKLQFDFLVHRPERGAYEDEIEELGGNIYRISPINPLLPNAYYKELNEFFNKHPYYKIVHSHINTFSQFPLKIAQERGIQCRISHAHIALEKPNLRKLIESKVSFQEEIKKIIKYNLRKRVSKNSTHRFSCGLKAGNWLFENNQFDVVNNAIDTEDFIYNDKVRVSYRKNMCLSDKTVIGHVGRFNEQKNHLFLLYVFRSILALNPNSILLLIGDGSLRTSILNYADKLNIKDKVLLLGVRDDIPNLLQTMDVFLFPSLYEGLPVTLIEAQASGLKVFASDTITKEVALTDDITYMSLNEPAKDWAEKIVASLPYNRKNNYEIIKAKGYDIKENARNLQSFYLDQINAL